MDARKSALKFVIDYRKRRILSESRRPPCRPRRVHSPYSIVHDSAARPPPRTQSPVPRKRRVTTNPDGLTRLKIYKVRSNKTSLSLSMGAIIYFCYRLVAIPRYRSNEAKPVRSRKAISRLSVRPPEPIMMSRPGCASSRTNSPPRTAQAITGGASGAAVGGFITCIMARRAIRRLLLVVRRRSCRVA